MINFCPIERLLFDKLLSFFNSSTVVLNFFDIAYRLSPLITVYIIPELLLGIISFWPIERLLLDKLLIFFNSLTEVLKLIAIRYKLSPLFTVYIFSVVILLLLLISFLLLGIINFWLIERRLLERLLSFFISSTVVLNFFEIEYKLSPDTIFM